MKKIAQCVLFAGTLLLFSSFISSANAIAPQQVSYLGITAGFTRDYNYEATISGTTLVESKATLHVVTVTSVNASACQINCTLTMTIYGTSDTVNLTYIIHDPQASVPDLGTIYLAGNTSGIFGIALFFNNNTVNKTYDSGIASIPRYIFAWDSLGVLTTGSMSQVGTGQPNITVTLSPYVPPVEPPSPSVPGFDVILLSGSAVITTCVLVIIVTRKRIDSRDLNP